MNLRHSAVCSVIALSLDGFILVSCNIPSLDYNCKHVLTGRASEHENLVLSSGVYIVLKFHFYCIISFCYST